PIGEYNNGRCPDSHPVQLISIFYEVIYQTNLFADRWWSDGQQPFVFSQGDRTGYGFHADFVNGWDVDVLQKAVDECTNDSGRLEDCPVFGELFTNDECQACRLPQSVDEELTGNLTSLPGCNPPTDGPEYATAQSCDTPEISSPTQYFTNMIQSVGWEYQGCASDDIASRTLTGGFTWSDDMTVQHCVDYCKGEGFSLAGLEYANQCYCGNDYANQAAAPDPKILGNCWQPCAGNDQEVCGGSAALSVYKSCDGGACSNAVFQVNGTESASSGGESSEKRRRHIHKHAHGHAKFH
ncbi:WSC-domain-containing protein, partial [Hortaea werneckii]